MSSRCHTSVDKKTKHNDNNIKTKHKSTLETSQIMFSSIILCLVGCERTLGGRRHVSSNLVGVAVAAVGQKGGESSPHALLLLQHPLLTPNATPPAQSPPSVMLQSSNSLPRTCGPRPEPLPRALRSAETVSLCRTGRRRLLPSTPPRSPRPPTASPPSAGRCCCFRCHYCCCCCCCCCLLHRPSCPPTLVAARSTRSYLAQAEITHLAPSVAPPSGL